MTERTLPERLRKMATCVYIAVEKSVADDISDGLLKAADALDAKSVILAEAERALAPFAEWIKSRDANYASAGYPDACPLAFSPDRPNNGAATVGDLRRAAGFHAKLKAATKES